MWVCAEVIQLARAGDKIDGQLCIMGTNGPEAKPYASAARQQVPFAEGMATGGVGLEQVGEGRAMPAGVRRGPRQSGKRRCNNAATRR